MYFKLIISKRKTIFGERPAAPRVDAAQSHLAGIKAQKGAVFRNQFCGMSLSFCSGNAFVKLFLTVGKGGGTEVIGAGEGEANAGFLIL